MFYHTYADIMNLRPVSRPSTVAPSFDDYDEDQMVNYYTQQGRGKVIDFFGRAGGKVFGNSKWRPSPDNRNSEYAGTSERHAPGYNFAGEIFA